MKQTNPTKVHDVPEVPAHENIHPTYRREGDMKRVRTGSRPQNPPLDVGISHAKSLLTVRKHDHVLGRHPTHARADGCRSLDEFSQRVRRENQGVATFHKSLPQREAHLRELEIFAPAKNR